MTDNKKTLEELKQSREKLKNHLDAIEKAITTFEQLVSLETLPKTTKQVEDITYPITGSWNDKLFYAVTILEHASPLQVSEVLYHFEPEQGKTHLLNVASQYLPVMYSKGLLTRIKQGKPFIYSINKEQK